MKYRSKRDAFLRASFGASNGVIELDKEWKIEKFSTMENLLVHKCYDLVLGRIIKSSVCKCGKPVPDFIALAFKLEGPK